MTLRGSGVAVAGIAGVAVVLLGLLLLTTPPLAAGLTTSEAIVSLLGVVALVVGLFGLVRGVRTDRSADRVPSPLESTGRDWPGATFDRQLLSRSAESRDRLETAAVDVLTRLRGLDTETARDKLDRGTWTADRAAAAFFSPDVVDRTLDRATWLGGDPAVVRQARAAVGALARIVHEETRSPVHGADGERVSPGDERGDSDVPTGRPPTDLDTPTPADVAEMSVGGDAEPVGGTTPTADGAVTGRWTGVGSLALVTVGLALVARRPGLLVPAAVGVAMVAYAAYGRAGTAPEVSLVANRRLSTATPAQGEQVRVTVTVHNEGERVLPDVRLVDGVPDELPVSGGRPRSVATLRPDESVRFTYTVTAEYGTHEFDPAVAVLRDVTGERERVVRPRTQDDALSCRPAPGGPVEVPLRAETTGHAGRITADDGGSGLSFHAVRDHRPGDPLSLVDWKRFARTGDLATIEFQRERRTDVVLAVDSREVANRAPNASTRTARHRAVEAADRLATTLLETGNHVGISAVSAAAAWLAPGNGTEHRVRLRELLATAPAFTAPPTDEPFVRSVYAAGLRRQLSEGTQVVLLSPLVDDTPLDLVHELEASGVPVTVVSPDPTSGATVGGLLASVERSTRIATLRRDRVSVVDWAPDDDLDFALAQADALPVVVG